jgi:hypothetical protein
MFDILNLELVWPLLFLYQPLIVLLFEKFMIDQNAAKISVGMVFYTTWLGAFNIVQVYDYIKTRTDLVKLRTNKTCIWIWTYEEM